MKIWIEEQFSIKIYKIKYFIDLFHKLTPKLALESTLEKLARVLLYIDLLKLSSLILEIRVF